MAKNSVRPGCWHTEEAGLCALGVYLRSIDFWKPFEVTVRIPQKTVRYTPLSKWKTLVCLFLAQGRHIVETNKRVRPDKALCAAFGCAPCEQSVLQETLSACDGATVAQFRDASREVYQRNGRAMRHPFLKKPLVLDVDLTGKTCGKKAEGSTKGYFAHHKNKTGRQVGRVLASAYDEVVCEEVYTGTEQLAAVVPTLVERAACTLRLSNRLRKRTLLRLDGGGGTKEDIRWLDEQGYPFVTKLYSWQSARALRDKVERWIDDPRTPGRQVGLVPGGQPGYPDGVTLIGMRFQKADGSFGGSVVAASVSVEDLIHLVGSRLDAVRDEDWLPLAYALLYDLRGGGIETSFREDKQGLALSSCNKRSLQAERIIVTTLSLAHNVIVWARHQMAIAVPALKGLGIQRMVRDIFHILGRVTLSHKGRFTITLRRNDPYAREIRHALSPLLTTHLARLRLDEI